mmetsp:Transcript_50931/g.146326  ORF Transcript_50931/g.146326 Transcript_50931/m.146326 type:complete len:213 (-) Transcript_50931:221-859(-)
MFGYPSMCSASACGRGRVRRSNRRLNRTGRGHPPAEADPRQPRADRPRTPTARGEARTEGLRRRRRGIWSGGQAGGASRRLSRGRAAATAWMPLAGSGDMAACGSRARDTTYPPRHPQACRGSPARTEPYASSHRGGSPAPPTATTAAEAARWHRGGGWSQIYAAKLLGGLCRGCLVSAHVPSGRAGFAKGSAIGQLAAGSSRINASEGAPL